MNRLLVIAVLVGGCGDDARPTSLDAGVSDGRAEDSASAADADGERDAGGGDAAAVDAGGEADAGPDARAPDDTGPPCGDECSLYVLDERACDGRFMSCRLRGCSTYCGGVSPTPLQYGDECSSSAACDRGLQCLAPESSGSGACFKYCRLGHDEDCRGGGAPSSATCGVRGDLRDIDDDVGVVLPSGFGVCG